MNRKILIIADLQRLQAMTGEDKNPLFYPPLLKVRLATTAS